MGQKYSTNTISGYNASPPPDDGTTGADNLVTWLKHKSKLGDPLKTLAEAINTDLLAGADNAPNAKASNYPTVASDNGRVIEASGTTTITLGTAATMGAGYEVTVKNAGAAVITVATGDTIDGSGSNRTLQVGESETYVVNNAASGYMLQGNKGITATETVELTNKTLTTPTITNPTVTTGTFDTPALTTPAIDVGSDAHGDVYFRDTSGVFSRLAPGTDGYFLKTQGAAADPEWAIAAPIFGTAVATTSGSAIPILTGIPATANVIVIILNQVSHSGSAKPLIQVGHTSGTYLGTGYVTTATRGTSTTAETFGFGLTSGSLGGDIVSGIFTLTHMGSNLWVGSGTMNDASATRGACVSGGYKAMGANVLDSIQLNDAAVGNFDGGSVRAYYY